MPSPKRRPKRLRDALTPGERDYLVHGAGDGFDGGDAEARIAWTRHRVELYADAHEPLVPWAAIAFDGEDGHCSPYCHLGDPGCRRAHVLGGPVHA